MKKLFILLLFFFSVPSIYSALTEKEKLFIITHDATPQEKQIINEIFNNLDSLLIDLLNGQSAVISTEDYKKLFEQANFTVYNFRSVQCEEKGSDGYPARVILKHEKLPGYFIKIGFDRYSPQKNISRIMYAELINMLIDDPSLNITTIKKIYKKLCKRPGALSDDLIDMNYIVLSPEKKGMCGSSRVIMQDNNGVTEPALVFDTQKQYEDCTLLKETLDIRDSSPENLIFTDDGKITIIDTEILQDWIIERFIETSIEIVG